MTIAEGRSSSEPPKPKSMGRSPRMAAPAVISLGRTRPIDASRTARGTAGRGAVAPPLGDEHQAVLDRHTEEPDHPDDRAGVPGLAAPPRARRGRRRRPAAASHHHRHLTPGPARRAAAGTARARGPAPTTDGAASRALPRPFPRSPTVVPFGSSISRSARLDATRCPRGPPRRTLKPRRRWPFLRRIIDGVGALLDGATWPSSTTRPSSTTIGRRVSALGGEPAVAGEAHDPLDALRPA